MWFLGSDDIQQFNGVAKTMGFADQLISTIIFSNPVALQLLALGAPLSYDNFQFPQGSEHHIK